MRRLWTTSFATVAAGMVLAPATALATQQHGGMEGLYVHQAAHLFFMVSMAMFLYWLRKRGLVRSRAWRCIQYSAIFFILWNLDAFIVHELDEHLNLVMRARVDTWHWAFDTSGGKFVPALYYILKMDHLLCVPALAFLWAGLRRLLAEAEQEAGGERVS
ncbi:MAG: hypothetical protein ACLFOY_18000 [Desulfatibacillaceae bacterium]